MSLQHIFTIILCSKDMTGSAKGLQHMCQILKQMLYNVFKKIIGADFCSLEV